MGFKRTARQHFHTILMFLMSAGKDKRALVFAYRLQGGVKDRYIGCMRKFLTPDAIDAIVAAVNMARPHLPSDPAGAENGATT